MVCIVHRDPPEMGHRPEGQCLGKGGKIRTEVSEDLFCHCLDS